MIFSLGGALFDLPLEEKLRYDIVTLEGLKTNGKVTPDVHYRQLILPRYKSIKRNVGGLPEQRDGFEGYTVRFHGISLLTMKMR